MLNAPEHERKVADIVSTVITSRTHEPQMINAFVNLVGFVLGWVDEARSDLHEVLTDRYEDKSYEELSKLPDIVYTAPDYDAVNKNR